MRKLILTLASAALALTIGIAPARAEHLPQTVESNEAIGTDRVEITQGHVDLGPRIVDGQWLFLGRDDTVSPPVWRHLNDLVLRVSDHAKLTVPNDPNYSFLPQGKQLWVVPQTQNQQVVWVGWSTQDPAVVAKLERGGWLELKGVDGPGRMVTFVANGFDAPTQLWDSAKKEPQKFWVNANTHTHLNWAFDKPGRYLVHIDFVAKLKDGKDVRVPARLIYLVGNNAQLGEVPPLTSTPESAPAPVASSMTIWWWVIGGVAVLLVALVGWRLLSGARAKKEAASERD